MCGSGFSSRLSRRLRKPAVIAASTTSLTVPPSDCLISLMSSREARAQAYRRCRPIGPDSDELTAARPEPPTSMTAACAASLARCTSSDG